MLVSQRDDQSLQRTRALAEGIKSVAAELRLIDVADFVAFIHAENFANIQDIVNSSVELFFKHGTLTYGHAAEFDVTWHALPSITLDMEFHHKGVSVYFSLMLRNENPAVEIRYISFDEAVSDPDEQTRLLIDALRDASLSRPGL